MFYWNTIKAYFTKQGNLKIFDRTRDISEGLNSKLFYEITSSQKKIVYKVEKICSTFSANFDDFARFLY